MKLNIAQNAIYSFMARIVVQIVRKTWDVLTKSCLFSLLLIVVHPYQWFHPALMQQQVLLQQLGSYASVKYEHTLFEEGHSSTNLME